jgi:hypothetical protein
LPAARLSKAKAAKARDLLEFASGFTPGTNIFLAAPSLRFIFLFKHDLDPKIGKFLGSCL